MRANQKGAALVLVLLVTAAMAAIIAEIITTVHGQANRTENLIEAQNAAKAAEGGVELAAGYLDRLDGDYTYLEKNRWSAPIDSTLLEVAVEDESGKLLANSVVYPNGAVNEAAWTSARSLFKSVGVEPSLLEALADWIDMDDIARANGAEAAYYNRLSQPYAAKNDKLNTIGELSLVKGFDAGLSQALSPYLTVYTDGLVNLNTASREVIMSLSDDITPVMADRLIERRNEKPFKHTNDIRNVSGFETLVFSLQGRVKVKSDIFRIRTRATSGGAVREVEAVLKTGANKRVLYWRAR